MYLFNPSSATYDQGKNRGASVLKKDNRGGEFTQLDRNGTFFMSIEQRLWCGDQTAAHDKCIIGRSTAARAAWATEKTYEGAGPVSRFWREVSV